jgi:glutamyl-tRNA synthetase
MEKMNIITRFAPSPTGMLHVGNARTAIVNYLFAKANGGKFMLRIDDTDLGRSKEEYVDAIKQDLTWLGFQWDIFARQSERFERYNNVRDELIKAGRLYECFETSEELETKRKLQLSSGRPPIYDRAALKLTQMQKDAYIKEGRKAHYRFRLQDGDIKWSDMVRGEIKFDSTNLSDPILIREDGTMTYMISSTVDDIDFKISHVIRGEDHITNTALQIQLFEAMNSSPPQFGHLALITTKEEKISKRIGGFDLKSLREESGIEPMAINSLFSALGSSMQVVAHESLNEIVKSFDISKFSRNAANYSFDDLERLNHKIVSNFEYSEVRERLKMVGLKELSEDFWIGIRANLDNINDAKIWWNICHAAISTKNLDKEFLKVAHDLLPEGEITPETWSVWTKLISLETGKKGKELFMPLRMALTGMDHGPEMSAILPLVGMEKVKERLL